MTATETPVVPDQRSSRRLTTSKAMVEAIELEMERDPSVFYLGEDVGAYGGIFSSTTGLLDDLDQVRRAAALGDNRGLSDQDERAH